MTSGLACAAILGVACPTAFSTLVKVLRSRPERSARRFRLQLWGWVGLVVASVARHVRFRGWLGLVVASVARHVRFRAASGKVRAPVLRRPRHRRIKPREEKFLIDIELTAIGEDLTYNAPLSPARAATLMEFLAGGSPSVSEPLVLDLGCGWAQLLLQVVQADPSATGIGIDLDPDSITQGRSLAESLGISGRVELRCADVRTGSPTTADAVVCIGASHIWGPPVEEAQPLDYAAALGALRVLVPCGGRVLYGESIWSRSPTPRATAALAGRDDEYLTLPGLIELAVDHGFALEQVQEASQAEWDAFESGHLARYARWLDTHDPDHPDHGNVRQRAARQRSDYLNGYRGILGLAYLGLIAI